MDRESLPEDLKEASKFHGHLCPGLVIGYRASLIGLKRLGVRRAEDEELICIVENNSCSVDAVQYLTGCTFGKGNLFFKDYGKQTFTFARREQAEKAIRVSLKPMPFSGDPNKPNIDDPQRAREMKIEEFLNIPEEEMFWVDQVDLELPEEARILPSLLCDKCGEPTMQTRLTMVDGKRLCIPCRDGWDPSTVHKN